MSSTDAYARLRALGTPVITTTDTAALLSLSADAANKVLTRLARGALIARVRHGLWALAPPLDPHLLAPYLTAPHPSYVSLQSALYLHGMIEQVPVVIYVVSLDRSRRIATAFGTFSVHRVAPEFFGGFEVTPTGVHLATPEKALVDVFYLSSTRTRLFAKLPELELPRGFSERRARAWVGRIPSRRLKAVVHRRLGEALAGRRTGA